MPTFQPVSIVVTGYLVQKDLDEVRSLGTGSDHAHVTAQHIQKLGQFIQTGLA